MPAKGEKVILVRRETSPEDVGGMFVAQGIVTATGGKTSHAAVVARGWGKCCIVGCEQLDIDYTTKTASANGRKIREGDWMTLDGNEGAVYEGAVKLSTPKLPDAFSMLMKWADGVRRLGVRTNADTPHDAKKAREMGAEGIGLVRTEHMFFKDFEQPEKSVDQELADKIGVDVEVVARRVAQLHESNPMLGHRGCRLCITYPEILEMQVQAIIEAAVECKKSGIKVFPEIMHPLVMDKKELQILADATHRVAGEIIKKAGVKLEYSVGTMIEVPRAAILGGEIAEIAEFFSFGTNDLTQMGMGLSRDDAGRFLPDYVDEKKAGIFASDPFQSLDVHGVGQLMLWCIERGRAARPKLKIGICGEHGGEAASVKFCHQAGLDYVSASPYLVPIARLAAAQAVIEERAARKRGKKKGGKKR